MLAALVAERASIAFAPSLMTRFGPSATVANFSTFFVLLPVALAFIAIGIPFALRTGAAMLRRELERRERIAVSLVAACLLMLVVEARVGGSGLWSFAAMAALSYWQLWPAFAEREPRLAQWCSAVAGASALGLAAYQWSFVRGAQASQFVAPTFLVVTFYTASVGVGLAIPTALRTPRKGAIAAFVVTVAAAGWLLSPSLRTLSASVGDADILEFSVTTAAGALLVAAGLLGRLRS
jgi:hypothetical protein